MKLNEINYWKLEALLEVQKNTIANLTIEQENSSKLIKNLTEIIKKKERIIEDGNEKLQELSRKFDLESNLKMEMTKEISEVENRCKVALLESENKLLTNYLMLVKIINDQKISMEKNFDDRFTSFERLFKNTQKTDIIFDDVNN